VLQVWDEYRTPGHTHSQRYLQADLLETGIVDDVYFPRWARKPNEDEGRMRRLMKARGVRKAEMFIYPRGYISPLLIESELFTEKTFFVLQGRVSESANANSCA
jgi:hypothetical protein